MEADGAVLFQAPCPEAEHQEPQTEQGSAHEAARGTVRASPVPLGCNGSTESGRSGDRVTLTAGHIVLHVCPRKLLAAPDTGVLVSSTAQHKVQKNMALRAGHNVSWYVNTHARTRAL